MLLQVPQMAKIFPELAADILYRITRVPIQFAGLASGVVQDPDGA
jgi:hypothetical protein